jgi:hypothetical protein
MSAIIRLPASTHQQLTDLARQRQQTPRQVLAMLVETAWREQWLEAANADYAAWIADHPAEYAAHQAEMRLWDSRLADGLEPEQ